MLLLGFFLIFHLFLFEMIVKRTSGGRSGITPSVKIFELNLIAVTLV
jgi:hypothetical protein